MDAAFRAPLPFLTLIAASYGATTEQAGWLAVALSLAGLVAPIVGIVEGKFGRRSMTITSAGLFILSCFLMPFAPTFVAVLVLYVTLGVAKSLFTPQVQAFVGDNVPYEKRGTAFGFIELSWALGWIVGVPLFGFLIERASWWSSFLLFGAIGLLGLVLVLRFAIKRDDPALRADASLLDLDSVRRVLRDGPAVRLLFFGVLIAFTAQLATLVYAPYLVREFTLSPAQLGLASVVLGVADVVAELATVVLVDRFGKWRSVVISCIGFALSLFGVIALSQSLVPMLAGLFFVFLTFEFALVASLAVVNEVVPQARATMSGFVVATHSFGRIVASAIALPLFALGGLPVVMVLAGLLTALAVVVYWPVRVGE